MNQRRRLIDAALQANDEQPDRLIRSPHRPGRGSTTGCPFLCPVLAHRVGLRRRQQGSYREQTGSTLADSANMD